MTLLKYWQLSKYLWAEVQVDKEKTNDLMFRVSFATKTDHGGIDIIAQVGKTFLGAKIYDSRHWNYDEDRHMLPGEEEELARNEEEFVALEEAYEQVKKKYAPFTKTRQFN